VVRAHAESIQPLINAADFTSYEKFYSTDRRRRGDDLPIGSVADCELWWKVVWLPRTQEVIAHPTAWTDPRWHPYLYGGDGASGAAFGGPIPRVAPSPVPQLVFVLGRVECLSDACALAGHAASLDDIRAALLFGEPVLGCRASEHDVPERLRADAEEELDDRSTPRQRQ
jgi:hypothetical protein